MSERFYKAMLGISTAPHAVGSDQLVTAPNVADDLIWARGSNQSVRGEIGSD